jgi:hypothetical protein
MDTSIALQIKMILSDFPNLRIEALLGLTHSSVSCRVAIMRKRIAREQKLKKQINTI